MKFGLGYDWKEVKRFKKLDKKDRSIIFYLENEYDFIFFKPIVEKLTQEYDIKICYVTSSKTDPMLTSNDKNILPFYIGDGIARSSFFVNLKATIVVMTMPDLETFHIKRSKIYPVHYVYIFHSLCSTHYIYRKTAFDNFDTIFCTGNYQIIEIQEREKKSNLAKKKLVKHGYGRLDILINEVQSTNVRNNASNNKVVLIAPTWGPNGLIETKGQEIVHVLLDSGFNVILRPHPMTIKKSNNIIQKIEKEFKDNLNFKLETDIRNTESLFLCDCMISDWSGVAIEYAFVFEKPIFYIDTPQKINNPEHHQIGLVPLEEKIRLQIGEVLSLSQLSLMPSKINQLLQSQNKFKEKIQKIKEETVFNIGNSGEQGAKYLLELEKSLVS
jgi:YidC/Oxa1 family membrane protein insertase